MPERTFQTREVDPVKRKKVLDLLKAITPFPARGDTRMALRTNKDEPYEHFALGRVIKLDEQYSVESAFNKRYPDLYKAMKDLIRSAVPNWKYDSIQVNKSFQSAPHKDRNNLGTSYIIALGNFTGGQLLVGDELKPVNVKNRLVQFDGRQLHATAPFKGDRYSLIFFSLNRKRPPRLATTSTVTKAKKSPAPRTRKPR